MSLILETCSVNELCRSFGGSEELLIELTEKLAYWLKLQQHLPQDLSEKRLQWFIINNKLSLERAKRKLEGYYTVRRLLPEFFESRDPRGPGLAVLHDQVQGVLLPKLAPGNYRAAILRGTANCSANKLNFWDLVKYIFMTADIRMIEDCCYGEIIVFDLSRANMGLVMKITPTLLRKIQMAALNGYASFLKGIHVINAPPFVDRVITLAKAILHPKLVSRLHVYRVGNLEQLYEFVPKAILPKDYGGDERSMAELAVMLRNKNDEWRDWFLEQEKVVANKGFRPTNPAPNDNNIFGFTGSFRKLEID